MTTEPDTKPAYLSKDYQRLWDLVRYARGHLQDAGLITLEEYASLVSEESVNTIGYGSPAVKRLESYDQLRAELTNLRSERDGATALAKQMQERLGVVQASLGRLLDELDSGEWAKAKMMHVLLDTEICKKVADELRPLVGQAT